MTEREQERAAIARWRCETCKGELTMPAGFAEFAGYCCCYAPMSLVSVERGVTVAMAVQRFLEPYSDSGCVDSGHGFGESCLDFWMDGKAVRVIVKSVPVLDRDK